jgi:hypothetical protein
MPCLYQVGGRRWVKIWQKSDPSVYVGFWMCDFGKTLFTT